MIKITAILVILFTIANSQINSVTREPKILVFQSQQPNFSTITPTSKLSIATKFIQHYNSKNSIIFLVEQSPIALKNAYNFYNNLVKNYYTSISSINFLLLEYNAIRVSEILETTRNNKQQFVNLLKFIGEPSKTIGNEYEASENSAATFGAILKATLIATNNSGIIVFPFKESNDEILGLKAKFDLNEKQVRLYVVNNGESDLNHQLLNELSISSGGQVYKADKELSRRYYEHFLKNLKDYSTVSTILSRKNLHDQEHLQFPVDSNVESIHINASPNLTVGFLQTPLGNAINVLSEDAVTKYGYGSFIKFNKDLIEIHLDTKNSRNVGDWSLIVDNDNKLYSVDIYAHAKLTATAIITYTNSTGNFSANKQRIMKLKVAGSTGSINKIDLVKKNGAPILNIPNFHWNFNKSQNLVATSTEKQIDVNFNDLPTNEPLYAVINGQDSQGHEFTRLSYVTQTINNEFFNVPALSIDVSYGSEVITEPNSRPEIIFEVTNNYEQTSLVRFEVRDEQAMLIRLDPFYKWISPQETATVRVTLNTRQGLGHDLVTLVARGAAIISKKVRVDIGAQSASDTEEPRLDYKFLSDCTENYGKCYDKIWAVEIRASDAGSGLLKLESQPKGLYYSTDFISGTRQEIKAYYWQSCCYSSLELTAIDRRNNRNSKHVNGYRAPLGPGAIAAIVLGVVLLILLILFIIYCIWHPPGKSESGSFDLPTYRGPSGRKY